MYTLSAKNFNVHKKTACGCNAWEIVKMGPGSFGSRSFLLLPVTINSYFKFQENIILK